MTHLKFCLRHPSLPAISFSFQLPTSKGLFVNGDFKLLVNVNLVKLPFIIGGDLKGDLLLSTITVILTKVCSSSEEIAKAVTLSNNDNNNNNNVKQTL